MAGSQKKKTGQTAVRPGLSKKVTRAAFFWFAERGRRGKALKKEEEQRQAIEMLCTDMLVPQDHLLRKIDAAVDFNYIYELVEGLYSEDNGRASCDPAVLFKLEMIQPGAV